MGELAAPKFAYKATRDLLAHGDADWPRGEMAMPNSSAISRVRAGWSLRYAATVSRGSRPRLAIAILARLAQMRTSGAFKRHGRSHAQADHAGRGSDPKVLLVVEPGARVSGRPQRRRPPTGA